MDQLPIYTLIHNQYHVLDHSGRLPFSIVFGLCRRSSQDLDARPLILDTRRSALDVPYALAHDLLKLNVEDAELKQETALAVSRLSQFGEEGAYVTLPSPVGRKANWKKAIVTYRYRIDPDSELAAIFKPGRRYQVRFAREDLGVKWYAYGDQDDQEFLSTIGEKPTQEETGKSELVNKPTHGKCNFKVVSSLPWPPRLHMRLELVKGGPNDAIGTVLLQVSVMNPGPEPLTVQTRGFQRFLHPWGPMHPEVGAVGDARTRIVDPRNPRPTAILWVTDKSSRVIVRRPRELGPSGPGVDRDPRPRLEWVTTIEPGNHPVIRLVDLGKQLAGLSDGLYEVRLEPMGMWWCEGRREEFAKEGDRVPDRVWNQMIPPAMLESEDTVEVRVEDGKIVL